MIMHLATPVHTRLPLRPVGIYSVAETTRLLPGAPLAPSDLSLLARVAEGDLEAFHTFYGRYAGRVLAYVRQLSRNREGAEDVVQEVFVAVWRRAGRFPPARRRPPGWLYTITTNKPADLWRGPGGTPPTPGHPAEPHRPAGPP